MENSRIRNAFSAVGCYESMHRLVDTMLDTLEHDGFVNLAYEKAQRIKRLSAKFAGRRPDKLFLLNSSINLGWLRPRLPGVEVKLLDIEYFKVEDDAEFARRAEEIRGGIVIVTNNDVSRCGLTSYARFYEHCEETVFCAWDFDNHHWLQVSIFLAAFSDTYTPAHRDNLYLLTKFNPYITPVENCGVVQWDEDFIRENLRAMIEGERVDEPLGRHTPYARFKYRQRVMMRLHEVFPAVGPADPGFHGMTREEKLKEWAGHKLHWIIPTLDDVPIRMADALITGGIPIVPVSQRYLLQKEGFDPNWMVFYTVADLIDDPAGVVRRGLAQFEAGGREGVRKRIEFALEHLHGNARLSNIWHNACDVLKTW